jgi:hypothetical protein
MRIEAMTAGHAPTEEVRFYFKLAVAMALTVVAGFGLQLAMGRSSFAAPPVVHAHAVVFMGWVGIYVLQNWLVASGNVALHRRVGWFAVAWVGLLIWFGLAVTASIIQRGAAPFFFLPQHFMMANPIGLLGFVILLAAAVTLRRRTDWHRRLHLCAMAMLMGPAFGRILPMPLMTPYAFEIASLAGLIFPLVAIWREARAGAVHPAWRWGVPVMPVTLLLALWLGHSAVGASLYQWVTAGTPGAAVAPLEYGMPPGPPPK